MTTFNENAVNRAAKGTPDGGKFRAKTNREAPGTLTAQSGCAPDAAAAQEAVVDRMMNAVQNAGIDAYSMVVARSVDDGSVSVTSVGVRSSTGMPMHRRIDDLRIDEAHRDAIRTSAEGFNFDDPGVGYSPGHYSAVGVVGGTINFFDVEHDRDARGVSRTP